jgi:hypothetical protein
MESKWSYLLTIVKSKTKYMSPSQFDGCAQGQDAVSRFQVMELGTFIFWIHSSVETQEVVPHQACA